MCRTSSISQMPVVSCLCIWSCYPSKLQLSAQPGTAGYCQVLNCRLPEPTSCPASHHPATGDMCLALDGLAEGVPWSSLVQDRCSALASLALSTSTLVCSPPGEGRSTLNPSKCRQTSQGAPAGPNNKEYQSI